MKKLTGQDKFYIGIVIILITLVMIYPYTASVGQFLKGAIKDPELIEGPIIEPEETNQTTNETIEEPIEEPLPRFFCGNGVVESGEQCDDANTNNNDECLDTCFYASCPDGYIWTGFEECDDNDMNNNNDCRNTLIP